MAEPAYLVFETGGAKLVAGVAGPDCRTSGRASREPRGRNPCGAIARGKSNKVELTKSYLINAEGKRDSWNRPNADLNPTPQRPRRGVGR